MFSIGEFARLGLVSVRMLRHYDAIGLLRPAHVDPVSGYRSYQADQLARLNRIIAVKDLGFTLEQVGALLDEKISVAELHGMVRLRRAELEARISADLARLRSVEARLRTIETEGRMRTAEVVLKSVPRTRVAQLAARAAGYAPEHIAPVISPLFDELCGRLESAGIRIAGPGIAHYLHEDDGSVMVHACLPVNAEPGPHGFDVVDLPAMETAGAIIHHGAMDAAWSTFQALAHWIEENDYRSTALAREISLHVPPDRDAWVTELQIAVTAC
ncbi:MerR family transcriptional regulator [Nonomuraea sp. PA05]|uniref:MerR family transcriptional regulator n=1 Tax=Nonomuraea sp. PA05 TaxID=2604466 RepID=UPI0011DB293B|nr:MerR family transcriptional regulator [Nonomuraea sp. PA05]TYB59844.1 MerR family transcriptional regulator [Nonomuraea sp. PA05]